MRIVQGDEQPIKNGPSMVRSGINSKQYLMLGDSNAAGNFKYWLSHQVGDFRSPRHHHNFDQIRYLIEGGLDFSRNGKMKPGMLAYFPEGAYYGPQVNAESSITAILQFDGPSGSGFLSPDQLYAARDALKKIGIFEGGVFKRNPGVPGKKNMDGFQAVWEQAFGRPMVYPKPQYADPIMMNPDSYRWAPVRGMSGVEAKIFGTFTDCEIRCARYKLAKGTNFEGTGRGIYTVLSGTGSVEGQPMRYLTTVYVDMGEKARFHADQESEILLMGLPDIARMKHKFHAPSATREAA